MLFKDCRALRKSRQSTTNSLYFSDFSIRYPERHLHRYTDNVDAGNCGETRIGRVCAEGQGEGVGHLYAAGGQVYICSICVLVQAVRAVVCISRLTLASSCL